MGQQKGISLLEIVIAVGLISIILLALVSVSTKSISNTTYSREKNQASRLSQEAVEWLRSQRDMGWSTFYGYVDASDTWCLTTLAWDNAGACSGDKVPNTNLERQVAFTTPEQGVVEVRVTVTWLEGGNTNESVSETILTKWQ
jgi:Tfp pilus assembly protein PilV